MDARLHSYVTVMAQQAMEDARRADAEIAQGRRRGALHGVPLALKDLLWTRGVPTTHGMTLHRDHRPTEDATVVRRLREAGAVILGKLQQTEGAFADHHPEITAPSTPGAPSYGRGLVQRLGRGHGGGAVLRIAGHGHRGSIRFPSAANGITGLKPTWGRVSRHGAFELAASLDHIGPMARSAADAAAMLAAIAGRTRWTLRPASAACPTIWP